MPPMRHGPMGPRKPKNAKATIPRLFQYVRNVGCRKA